jgi:hypothetical protein
MKLKRHYVFRGIEYDKLYDCVACDHQFTEEFLKVEKEIMKKEYEFALLFPMDEKTVRAYEKQEKMKVIDVEPHWKNLVPAYLKAIKHGDEVQYAIAKNDIMRMAEICDRIRQTQKRGVTMVRVGSDYKSNGRPVGRPRKDKVEV